MEKAGDGLSMEIIQFLSGQFLTYFHVCLLTCFAGAEAVLINFQRGLLEHHQRGKQYSLWGKLRAKFMTCIA